MERMTNTNKEVSEKDILTISWLKAFNRATDFDAWGQPLEAGDIYQRLSKQLHNQSSNKDGFLFPLNQRKTLEKIALCLDARRKSLMDSRHEDCISLKDLKLLETTLRNLLDPLSDLSDGNLVFPVDITAASAQFKSSSSSALGNEQHLQEISSHNGKGSLQPKSLPMSGKTHLTICIGHIAVKDSSHFLDPYISVSVKSHSGQNLSCSQDTPTASEKSDFAIIFNADVHIEKPLENLSEGFAIFFEFKYFKPKKNSFSTYCWAFLEKDEVKEGPIALELYKKPTDFQRKCLKLLTVKPLFLHLSLNLYS